MTKTRLGLIFFTISIILSFSIYWPVYLWFPNLALLFGSALGILVIFCIGLELMWRGKREFGDRHKKFINIGTIFLCIYVLLTFFSFGLTNVAFAIGSFYLALLVPWVVLLFFLTGSFLYAYNLADKAGKGGLWSALGIGALLYPIAILPGYYSLMEAGGVLGILYVPETLRVTMIIALTIPQIILLVGYILAIVNVGKIESGISEPTPLYRPPEVPLTKELPIQPVRTKCYKCGEVMEVRTTKRPVVVKCTKCGTKGVLR